MRLKSCIPLHRLKTFTEAWFLWDCKHDTLNRQAQEVQRYKTNERETENPHAEYQHASWEVVTCDWGYRDSLQLLYVQNPGLHIQTHNWTGKE